MSLGSSTTQSTVRSRRGARPIRHWDSCATLPQVVQNFTVSLTSTRTAARRRTSTGSAASTWKAIRCALLGPTPGSRPSSSIRSWTTPSYTMVSLRAGGDLRRLRLGDDLAAQHLLDHGLADQVGAGDVGVIGVWLVRFVGLVAVGPLAGRLLRSLA